MRILHDKSEEITRLQRLLEEQQARTAEAERKHAEAQRLVALEVEKARQETENREEERKRMIAEEDATKQQVAQVEEQRLKAAIAIAVDAEREAWRREKEADHARQVAIDIQTTPQQLPIIPPQPALPDPQVAVLEVTLAKEREEWLAEKEKMQQQIVNLEASRATSRQESDFLRDEYRKASSAAASLSVENADLAQRTQIAEKQSMKGVEQVRAMFEARVKKLEEELDKSQALSKLLMEKDRRVNDDVRWRAAMWEEYERENRILKRDNEELDAEVEELKEEMERLSRQNDRLVTRYERLERERQKQTQTMMSQETTQEQSEKAKGKRKAVEELQRVDDDDDSDVFDDDFVPGRDSGSSSSSDEDEDSESSSTPDFRQGSFSPAPATGPHGNLGGVDLHPVRVGHDHPIHTGPEAEMAYPCSWRSPEAHRVCKFIGSTDAVSLRFLLHLNQRQCSSVQCAVCCLPVVDRNCSNITRPFMRLNVAFGELVALRRLRPEHHEAWTYCL